MDARHGALVTSVVCAALLAAGCDTADDRVARESRNSPPVIAPAPSSAPSGSMANKASAAAEKASVALDDTALTAKVKAALIAEPGLKSMPIDVTTNQSVVTLSGSVDSAVEKAKALQVAENVDGVKSVVDRIVAKS